MTIQLGLVAGKRSDVGSNYRVTADSIDLVWYVEIGSVYFEYSHT